ncbi:phosphoribosyl 1,2-cyclic phosphate phosphodiesterase [Pseudoxanthobacter soli DSM 19599]|uniref:Phosphoribosyl 1,2-cyclic phosphate phosphodiesterase n=1 Tax=Pseudoxanthobacter soli DSM 19599 TaxID=1123029 RepID=A0A1M7Z6M6_9HYPH|nr:MBL fold metallo-hydrolase [Pseudoxanthobacter soli]SHO60598.1 phosphoribosyl 1,2-cyclic phosphate phosphodiesterase [Pseudoxanthobacter soli DSM 19599]
MQATGGVDKDAMTDVVPRLEFTILGCGSSGGVPRVGGDWGACDPANPRNRRRRCSLLVRRIGAHGETTVLVDTGADMREQLLDAGVTALDAVLYTHAHADHIHGIDDLRALALTHRHRIDVYMDEPTSHRMHEAFGYCFSTPPGSNYPPILTEHRLRPLQPVTICGAGGDLVVLPFLQNHGEIDSLGFRFGGLAYSSDVNDLPDESLEPLADLDLWIVDALRDTPHVSHFSVADALHWIERVKPRRAVLTDLHVDLDYAELAARLPAGVEPAYDGQRFVLGVEGHHATGHITTLEAERLRQSASQQQQ